MSDVFYCIRQTMGKIIHGIDTPIIALTANAYDEDRRLCIESGMDAFVAKPITRNKITDAIVKVITNESDLASSNSLRSWLRQQQ